MKTFIELDYCLQTFLLYGTGLMLVFFPILGVFGLLGLLALGAWQLLSGLVTGLCFQKLVRNYYLPIALVYLGCICSVANFDLLPTFLEPISFLLALFFWIIIPYGIAVWYYRMVQKDYKKIKRRAPLKPIKNGLAMNCPYEEQEGAFYYDNWAM